MSESTLERGTELQGLSTAILLPGAGLFGDRLGRGLTDVGPLTLIGGLSLFQRTVLTLQGAGIRQLIVLAGADEELLKHTLARGTRVTIPVRWMPVREFPLDDPRTWEAVAAEVRGFCLIAGVQAVFSKRLIEHLRQTVRDGEAVVVTRDAGPVEPAMGRRNPAVAFEEGRLISFHHHTAYEGHQVAADLVVLPASILNPTNETTSCAVGGATDPLGMIPVRRWLEQAAVQGRVRIVAAASNAGLWYRDVWDQASAGVARTHPLLLAQGGGRRIRRSVFQSDLFAPLDESVLMDEMLPQYHHHGSNGGRAALGRWVWIRHLSSRDHRRVIVSIGGGH